jgi:hypothetical protein
VQQQFGVRVRRVRRPNRREAGRRGGDQHGDGSPPSQRSPGLC